MKPMRLMIVRSTISYGGPERQIIGFARRLEKGLFSPVVCTFTEPLIGRNPFLEAAESCGLETGVISAKHAFDLGGVGDLARLTREKQASALCPQDYRANIYAVLVGRQLGLPVISTAHGYTGHTYKVKGYELFDRLVLQAMAAVVCVSETLRVRLHRCGIPLRKLHRVYNSIDVAEVERDSIPERARGSAASVACSVGRLSREKGHAFLIDAWPEVLTSSPDAKLVLVGDGPERHNLEAQANRLGILGAVEFAGFTETPMSYVRACDVFVLPSLTEGLPVALLEACAAAKPVVASDVGGVGEVIAHCHSGILVRPRRSRELAEAITNLFADRRIAAEMGSRAETTVRQNFCYEKNVRDLERVYLAHAARTFDPAKLSGAGKL